MYMQIQIVAKTLVINTDGKVLILRRHDNDDYRPGQWDLPGGQADPGEDPRVAAVREAKEETTLSLSSLSPVYVTSHVYDDRQVVKTVFATTDYIGDVILSFEHDDYEWVTLEALATRPISQDYIVASQMLAVNPVVEAS